MTHIACYDFPIYSRDERKADAIVHSLGIGMALVAVPTLIWQTPADHRGAAITYGLALLAMLIASASYNMSRASHLKLKLRQFDYSAIFLKIAGGYTPVALALIGGTHGFSLWAAVWVVALAGVGMKLTQPRFIKKGSLALYVVLGWAIMFCSNQLTALTSDVQLGLIAAGGLTYTVGVIFHMWESLPYQNAIWHVFVLVGSAFIFAANWLILTGM
ncbi:MAG: hemolysin III family protein [Pseudomonadota bacterium]